MPVIYREDGSTAWGMITAVVVALLAVVGVGFFVFAQSQPATVVERGSTTTVVQPAAPATAPSTTFVPIPVQRPAGPAGAPGRAGNSGAAGAPGAPGLPGNSGPQGPEGAPAPTESAPPAEPAPGTIR